MNYATPNQGLAAFLLTIGQKVEDVEKRPSKFGGDSYFFVFELPSDEGRNMSTDFYEKKALIEPWLYYESMKTLREMLRDARANES